LHITTVRKSCTKELSVSAGITSSMQEQEVHTGTSFLVDGDDWSYGCRKMWFIGAVSKTPTVGGYSITFPRAPTHATLMVMSHTCLPHCSACRKSFNKPVRNSL